MNEIIRKRVILTETPEWQESNHWIQNQSLETLFSLRINEQDVPVQVLKDRVMYAVRAVLLLAVHTNIFGIQYNREKMNDKEIALALAENPDSKFVGILLVQLSLVALIKTHTVNKFINLTTYSILVRVFIHFNFIFSSAKNVLRMEDAGGMC